MVESSAARRVIADRKRSSGMLTTLAFCFSLLACGEGGYVAPTTSDSGSVLAINTAAPESQVLSPSVLTQPQTPEAAQVAPASVADSTPTTAGVAPVQASSISASGATAQTAPQSSATTAPQPTSSSPTPPTNVAPSALVPVQTTNELPKNEITLNNSSTNDLKNYPLQIGRMFRVGEVPKGECASFNMSGVDLETQIDIKNRWADGSIKFAILSAKLANIPAKSKTSILVKKKACELNYNKKNIASLLDGSGDFNINIEAGNGVYAKVTAREMIATKTETEWLSGNIVSGWILSDHLNKRFDFGSDEIKSLRPIVHVQKWAQLDLYRVRVIIEAADTTKLQDQKLSIKISYGNLTQTVLLETNTFTHNAGSRWSKEFWVGRDKPKSIIGINHNIAYLASTNAIPNYDASISVSRSTVENFKESFRKASKGPFERGLWTTFMGETGGRPEIGLFPSWHITMLYTDDPEFQAGVAELSDLAGAWRMHFRSGKNRWFDDQEKISGIGKPITRDGYPTQFFYDNNQYMNGSFVSADERFNILNVGKSQWSHDGAHQPEPWYLLYIITGDYWYLEQLQFWASWGLFQSSPGKEAYCCSGRDPRDTVIQDQTRGVAWLMRTRARAAYASPDGSPEQKYFSRATEQLLRHMEGVHIGSGSDPIRSWWASNGYLSENPLRFWTKGNPESRQGISARDVATGASPWQQSMIIMTLGHLRELGFNSGEILSWVAQSWISLIRTNSVDPRRLGDYQLPVMKTTGAFFQTWVDAFDDYTSWTSYWESRLNEVEGGTPILAVAAISFVRDQPGGDIAWNWVYSNGYSKILWSINPKFAILPR